MEKIYRRTFYIELDKKALKKCCSGKNYRDAYSDIEGFLLENGFERDKDFMYLSKEPMSASAVSEVAVSLTNNFPWLKSCIKKCFSEEVKSRYSALSLIKNPDKEFVPEYYDGYEPIEIEDNKK